MDWLVLVGNRICSSSCSIRSFGHSDAAPFPRPNSTTNGNQGLRTRQRFEWRIDIGDWTPHGAMRTTKDDR